MLEMEVHRLEQLTDIASVTAPEENGSPGLAVERPLKEAAPDIFEASVILYTQLLDASLQQRQYKLTPALSEKLRGLADQLGRCHCGPKDVIEIHKETLSKKRASISSMRFWGYISESRLLLLELMGYLGNHYRLRSAGQPVGP